MLFNVSTETGSIRGIFLVVPRRSTPYVTCTAVSSFKRIVTAVERSSMLTEHATRASGCAILSVAGSVQTILSRNS